MNVSLLLTDSNRIGILPSTLACVCVLYAVEVKLSSFYEFALKWFLDSTESEYVSPTIATHIIAVSRV